MINVLYLLNHAGKAGTERYVYSLVDRLNGTRINAFFAYNEYGLLVEKMEQAGVSAYRLVMKNPLDLKAAFKLSRLCKQLDIQVVHTQFLRENYIAMLSKLFGSDVKVIYTNHFIMRNNFAIRMFNRILSPLQSGVIAVCNKGKQMMISNGISAKKIKVVFNGVDPDFWGVPEKSTMREEFKIPKDEFVILCGSRFAHDKGHGFLVDSINALKKMTQKKFKCVLANDGPLLEDIKEQVKNLGLEKEIIFTGFRKDIKNLINGSDLYVNSSEHEALSFAIIEVLAAGLPVIATDMGGNRDIINERTNCGVLVEYNDVGRLAKEMERLMHDKKLLDKLKENALVAIKNVFNIENMVNRTYQMYK